MKKVGYYKSEYISPGLSNDGLSLGPDEGHLILPAEVYHHPERKLAFLIIRSGARSFKTFGKEL
jgi:hypothetical protein